MPQTTVELPETRGSARVHPVDCRGGVDVVDSALRTGVTSTGTIPRPPWCEALLRHPAPSRARPRPVERALRGPCQRDSLPALVSGHPPRTLSRLRGRLPLLLSSSRDRLRRGGHDRSRPMVPLQSANRPPRSASHRAPSAAAPLVFALLQPTGPRGA